MARKPIEHELKGLQTPRERVWAAVRKLRTGFTVWSVQDACVPNVDFETLREYVTELERAGVIVRTGGGDVVPGHGNTRTRPTFDLVKDQHDAPRLSKGAQVTQGLGVLAMWRAMKVLKNFSHHDIAAAASQGGLVVKAETAKAYVNALNRAGYLGIVTPAKPGTAARLRLVRNTGAHAPAITRRKCVFDRNLGTFAELETAQEVCDALE